MAVTPLCHAAHAAPDAAPPFKAARVRKAPLIAPAPRRVPLLAAVLRGAAVRTRPAHQTSTPPHTKPHRTLTRLHPTLTLLLTLVFFTCPAAARTWIVRPGGSIQAAIEQASSGDTILILPGEYREGLLIDGKRLSLVGFGADRTRLVLLPRDIGGAPSLEGLHVAGPGTTNTVVSAIGFTTDAADPVDYGIRADQPITIHSCSFADFPHHVSPSPAAVLLGSSGIVSDCSFTDRNTAIEAAGELTVSAAAFTHCAAGITSSHHVTLEGSHFDQCDRAVDTRAGAAVSHSSFANSSALGLRTRGNTTLAHCVFADNRNGASVASESFSSSLHIDHCSFTGHAFAALTVVRTADVLIRDSHFSENLGHVVRGGGLGSSLALARCVFDSNSGSQYLIEITSSTLDATASGIFDCRFSRNSNAATHIVLGATPDLAPIPVERCEFLENATFGDMLVHNVAVRACRFVRNDARVICRAESITASEFLGNVTTSLADASRFINCSFVGNMGSIIMAGPSPQSTLIAGCSFVSNPRLVVRGSRSTSAMRGSIIRSNIPTGRFLLGASITYSNFERATFGAGNINADPLFLRNPNPGPDQTWGTEDDDYGDLRLQPTSPCIDAADSTAFPDDVTTDLAGAPRFADDPATPDTGIPDTAPARPVADMGTHEFQPGTTPPSSICDLDANGQIDVHDLLAFLHTWTSADPAADFNNDGTVDVHDLLTFIDCFTNSH